MSRPKLSIALLSARGSPYSGGEGVYLSNLSRELVDRGHRVDMLCGQPYPDLHPDVRLVKLPALNLYGKKDRWLSSLTRLETSADVAEWLGTVTGGYPGPWVFGKRAGWHLRRHPDRYDLIHDNQTLSYELLDLKDMDIPVLSTVHHPLTIDRNLALEATRGFLQRLWIHRWYRFTRMQSRVARDLDEVITGSRQAERDLHREFGLDADQTTVIPYGVDTELFCPRSDVETHPERLIAVTSTQWLRQNKGFGTLLEACQRLVPKVPDLELVVVGSPDQHGLTEFYSHDMKIASHIVFLQDISVDKLVKLYNRAAVAVVPSLYEGFGLPAAEAMACGTPVVATRTGGLPEVVGDAGVLVPPGNPDRLADAVLDLLEDPGRRAELARRGRRRVERRFQWERTARLTESVYRKVLEERP